MCEKMVWEQQEDGSYFCEASDTLVYQISEIAKTKLYEALVGQRTFFSGGVATSWHPLKLNYKYESINESLNSCAADFAKRQTKHIVKSITETTEDGSVRYMVSEYN